MSGRAVSFFALKDTAGMLAVAPDFIEMLPIAIHACDASGRPRWCNECVAELWGRRLHAGDDSELFCGSFKLYGLEGAARNSTRMGTQTLRARQPSVSTQNSRATAGNLNGLIPIAG